MRCKPQDLVVVVRRGDPNQPLDDAFIGEVRRVTRLNARRTWEYEGSPLICPVRGLCTGLLDSALLPINDPGEDAVDEIVQLLGSPVKETV